MERRDFLKAATAAGIASATPGILSAQQPSRSDDDSTNESRSHSPDMIYRELGTTGQKVSAIGFGGAHLNKGDTPAPEMVALLRSPSTAASPFSTTAGTTATASARSAWARLSRTATAKRSSL